MVLYGMHLSFLTVIFATFLNTVLIVQAEQECKYTLTAPNDRFSSPNFPANYPNNQECTWNIKAAKGHYIKLAFDVMELEAYNTQCIDVIEVKDGATRHGELLGSYCEINRPSRELTSSSNHLRIWFHTDKSVTRRGFNASYTTHEEKGCGGSITAGSGFVSSPRFGQYPYPSGLSCEWVLSRPQGEYLRLAFLYFQVEYTESGGGRYVCPDKLEIWDGPANNATKIGSYCANNVQPLVISMTNRLKLLFTSDKAGRFIGFRAQFTTSLTPESGGQFPTSTSTNVFFKAPSSASIVRLVRDISSKYELVNINKGYTYRGCGGDFTSARGVFSSPNYPNAFPTLSNCIWRVTAPQNHYVSLRFTDFLGVNGTSPSCPFDHIRVLDSFTDKGNLIGRYCQENRPAVMVSSGEHMYIHFRSKLIDAPGRFQALYYTHSKECTASLGMSDGRISDAQLSASSYLQPAMGGAWCSQGQRNYGVVGEYFQIDLRNLTNITAVATQGNYMWRYNLANYVTTYKVEYSYDGNYWVPYIGDNENDTRKGYTEFVGNLNVIQVVKNVFNPVIIANMIRIIPTNYISGFPPWRFICLKAELFGCPYVQECGGAISTLNPGKISVRTTSRQSKKCSWLSVPSPPSIPGLILVLRFTYFDIPCSSGKVTIEKRKTGDIKSLCGSELPPPYLVKASEQIIIKVDAKAGRDSVGVDIKYGSESLGCGDIMQVGKEDSSMTSPDFPKSYGADQECSWILMTTPTNQITLRFDTFDLEPRSDSKCKDYVEVRDGQFKSAPVIDRFCGSQTPATIVSTDNYLYVTFVSNGRNEAKGFRALYKRVARNPTGSQKDAPQVQSPDKEERNKATTSKYTVSATIPLTLLTTMIAGLV